MKKIKSNLDVVFVIDKSGSMSGNEDNTISSFNEYLERESNNNYKTNVTTLFFNDTYEYFNWFLIRNKGEDWKIVEYGY